MRIEPEHRRAGHRLVAADSLEHAEAVLEAVTDEMQLGVGPVDELAVHPDLFRLFHYAVSTNSRFASGRTIGSPSWITHLKRPLSCSTLMFSSGLPSTMTRSASLPSSIEPMS